MNRIMTRKLLLVMILLSCMLFAAIPAQGNARAEQATPTPEQPTTQTPQTEPVQPAPKVYKLNHSQLIFSYDYNEAFKMLWFNKSKTPVVSYTYNQADGILFIKQKKINGRKPLMVYPLKAGTTSITVTDPNGTQTVVPVTVYPGYFLTACRENPHFTLPESNIKYDNELLYGEKKFVCYDALSQSDVSLKIDKDTYTYKANNEGSFKIKLKKIYKAGTKAIFTFKDADGKAYTKKARIQKWSELEYNKKLNKKFKMKVVEIIKDKNNKEKKKKVRKKMIKLGFEAKNIHNGDYVTVKINGETFQSDAAKKGDVKMFVKIPSNPKGTPFKATLRNIFDQKMLNLDCEL